MSIATCLYILFSQLWVAGELIGGCDIVTEMHEKGELKELIDEALGDEKTDEV